MTILPLLLALLLPLPDPAFNLASTASPLGARLDHAARLDTGALEVRFEDGDGAPLEPAGLDFRDGLWVEYASTLGAARVSGHAFALVVEAEGDRRLVTSWQLQVENPTSAPLETSLVLRAVPGPTHAGLRPVPSLAWREDETFELADGFVTRGGRAVLRVEHGEDGGGSQPAINVQARPAAADALAAELRWPLLLPPGATEAIVVHVAGAPAGDHVDEDAWRRAFGRVTFRLQFEQSNWQAAHQGDVLRMEWGDERVGTLIARGLLHARAASAFQYAATALSNRPYGHPATDAAAVAQMLGCFSEWGFGPTIKGLLATSAAGALDAGRVLDAAGRVALCHGLVTGIRVRAFDEDTPAVADAIRELVEAGAPVAPWLDPDVVRADLQDIVERAVAFDDAREPFEVPALAWAEGLDPASVRGRLQAARRALSAGDAQAAWTVLDALLAEHPTGLGALDPADEYDALFTVAMLSLLRATIVDDHGERLHLLPVLPTALVNDRGALGGAFLPTRFGRVLFKFFASGKRAWTIDVVPQFVRGDEQLVVSLPGGESPGETRDIKKVRTRIEGDSIVAEMTDFPGPSLVFSVLRAEP